MDIISHEFETTQCIQVFHLNIIKEDLKNTALLNLDFSESQKKMPTKTRSRELTLGNLHFLFLQHVLTPKMGKFALYQSPSLLNQMSTHVSLLYHAYIKLLVILRKRLEFLQNFTFGVMDWHHSSDQDLFSHFWAFSTLKRKLNSTLTRHIRAKMDGVGWCPSVDFYYLSADP